MSLLWPSDEDGEDDVYDDLLDDPARCPNCKEIGTMKLTQVFIGGGMYESMPMCQFCGYQDYNL